MHARESAECRWRGTPSIETLREPFPFHSVAWNLHRRAVRREAPRTARLARPTNASDEPNMDA